MGTKNFNFSLLLFCVILYCLIQSSSSAPFCSVYCLNAKSCSSSDTNNCTACTALWTWAKPYCTLTNPLWAYVDATDDVYDPGNSDIGTLFPYLSSTGASGANKSPSICISTGAGASNNTYVYNYYGDFSTGDTIYFDV
jgi:hypothetical protein